MSNCMQVFLIGLTVCRSFTNSTVYNWSAIEVQTKCNWSATEVQKSSWAIIVEKNSKKY